MNNVSVSTIVDNHGIKVMGIHYKGSEIRVNIENGSVNILGHIIKDSDELTLCRKVRRWVHENF